MIEDKYEGLNKAARLKLFDEEVDERISVYESLSRDEVQEFERRAYYAEQAQVLREFKVDAHKLCRFSSD